MYKYIIFQSTPFQKIQSYFEMIFKLYYDTKFKKKYFPSQHPNK